MCSASTVTRSVVNVSAARLFFVGRRRFRDDEAGVGHGHRAAEMRIAIGADRAKIDDQPAADVADHVGQTVEKAEIDAARLDRHVDRLLGVLLGEQGKRRLAGRRDPDAGDWSSRRSTSSMRLA